MKEKLIASRISAAQAIRKIGQVVSLAPGMPAALGMEDQLAEGALGLVTNVSWSSGWPHFTVSFQSDLLYVGLLEFEIDI